MYVYKAKFCIKQKVYLLSDEDQLPYMVIEIMFSKSEVQYKVGQGTHTYWAYGYELSEKPDRAKALGIKD